MVIKQIYFDEDSGRLMLSDDDNNHYLCNIYGTKLTEFIPNVSGIVSQRERGISFSKKFELNNSNYLPTIRFFEGYTHFPNPRSPVLNNSNLKNKQKLIELLRKNFKCEKVLELFSLKTNIGLPYLTAPLAGDESKKDRLRLIKIIDEYFDEYRKINKYKLNLMPKDPEVKALKKFKKLLLENIDMYVIHGRKLNPANEIVKKRYNSVKKEIRKIKDDNISLNNVEKVKEPYIDDMSFISKESENDKKYERLNILKVKNNQFFKNCSATEKLYIDGFKPTIKKEEGIIQKGLRRQFKTNGEFYLQDMELFKKVNPIQFNIMKEKEEYDLKELKKTLKQKYVLQKNSKL